MLVPKKSLGQNFLQDQNVVRKIAEAIRPESTDTVLEIGAGTGALTRELAGSGAAIVAIEVDPRAVQLLTSSFGDSLRIIQEDVRNVSLAALFPAGRPIRVVGNIPYYITSEILFWIFDQHEFVRDATLMMQVEVAERLGARPRTKEYGILSVFTEFYAVPKILFHVSRNSFYPRPNVDSAVVQLDMKERVPACDLRLFRNVVRTTFGQRRKTLRNGLRSMGCSNDQLQGLHFDLTRRPEELTAFEFLDLTGQLAATAAELRLRF